MADDLCWLASWSADTFCRLLRMLMLLDYLGWQSTVRQTLRRFMQSNRNEVGRTP